MMRRRRPTRLEILIASVGLALLVSILLQIRGLPQVEIMIPHIHPHKENLQREVTTPRSNRKEPPVKVRLLPNFRHRRSSRKKDNDEAEEGVSEVLFAMNRQWKEPEWEVAEVLRRIPNMTEPAIPVFVVEEHYEVLKYWFDAVETGVVPQSGNTVFHIDGHSDAAPPRDLRQVPWFRLPANHSEVANMMQANDCFIAAAALAGLVNRYIWVWPEWDKESHDDQHRVADIHAGYRTHVSIVSGEAFRVMCLCIRMVSEGETEFQCMDDRPGVDVIGDGPVDMDPSRCKIEARVLLENIHEDHAVTLLKQGGWIEEDEQILLDIDEDYFGCESSIMPLLDAGLTQRSVYALSAQVQRVWCVNDVLHEGMADAAFRAVLDAVQDFKARRFCPPQASNIITTNNNNNNKNNQNNNNNNSNETGNNNKEDKCFANSDIQQATEILLPAITDIVERVPAPAGTAATATDSPDTMLCSSSGRDADNNDNDNNNNAIKTRRAQTLRALVRSLLALNASQLNALRWVGVCLVTAPTNLGLFEPGSLHVCHGFNVPGDSVVTLHTPSWAESEVRAALLTRTLSLLPAQPSLVTVCRSMRDGYTPWSFFQFAEQAVFQSLKEVFEFGVRDEYFHFDENLLGGRKGWPNRDGK